MQLRTTHSEQIWQSPDGTRKIWEVTLTDDKGQDYRLKTYSPKIGQMGFEGDVKTYLNARGERFVRQDIAKQATAGSPYQRDDNAIRAQWAIGQAITLAQAKVDKKEDITMPLIERLARELFVTVGRVKGEEVTGREAADAERYIRSFTQASAV